MQVVAEKNDAEIKTKRSRTGHLNAKVCVAVAVFHICIVAGTSFPYWPVPAWPNGNVWDVQLLSIIVLFMVDIPVFCFFVIWAIWAIIVRTCHSILRFAVKDHTSRSKKWKLNPIVVSMAISFIIYLTFVTHHRIVDDRLATIPSKATPIVIALEKYREQEKSYPREIENLVPQYLEKLPATGIAGAPEFFYEEYPSKKDFYELFVPIPEGLGGWDVFLYQPDENYDELKKSAYVEKFGDWAFVRD